LKRVDKSYLDHLPPLRDVIRAHDLRAEKSLGQNFILDLNITDKIVGAAGDLSGCNIIEIGPGPGGLTRSLLRSDAQKVISIEYDPRAVSALMDMEKLSKGRLQIEQADALHVDFLGICDPPRKIVANLPYNISTVLLVNWLRQIRQDRCAYDGMTLMFQKEVAERICASPGNKAYGRLSVLAQWICHVQHVFDLPPNAFVPPPKVTSSIVGFQPLVMDKDAPAFEVMEKVTAAAFNQRRKMIRSSLKPYIEAVREAGIDETLRAEQLGIADFVKICKFIGELSA
jgi:16S rRNA (adenine1518-N6/adenine1519-N6)-dimethyltransferase